MNQPANILFLVSDPLDAAISIERDLIALQDALRDLDAAAVFDTRAAEAKSLQDHLERGDRPRYSVLHYLGHGYKPPQSQNGYLIFENRDGVAAPLDVTRLAIALTGASAEFKLAVVSACHSESVAQALFAVGVEHVVAIEGDKSVYEAAAIAFCRLFYQSLLTGNSLDRAFEAGRRALFTDETMRNLGDQKTQAEAAKFKLIPRPGADASQFRMSVAQGEADLQTLPSLTEPPFDQHPVEFIGRNDDMRDLLAALNAHRAAVVLGVSGVGKTELAKQTARRLVARRRAHENRVGFASMVNAKTAAEARTEIALAVGLAPDGVPDNGKLQRAVPRHWLVILDEAENVIAGDGLAFRQLLDALISAPAKPLVIVTSQTDPNTPKAPPVQARRLSDEAALRLFVTNANLDWEQFRRINRDHLLGVLGYVDRLPRAIELIARVWRQERGADPDNVDLTSLLAQLRADHDRVIRDPNYPDEVKSITIGVQFAYDRLSERSPAAAALWAQLALFPGGVSKAGLTGIFGDEVADLANEIERQSLVESSYSHFPEPFGHLLQLPTPFRFFALRHLPKGDEAAARQTIGEAVLRYYYNLPEEPHLGWIDLLDQSIREGGAATGAFVTRFNTELPSIESWLDWAYDHESGQSNCARAPRLTAVLRNLYVLTGELHKQRDRFNRAIACALRCADLLGEADMRWASGDLLMRVNDLKGAHEQYDAALALYSRIGHRVGEANTLAGLGSVLKAEDNLDGAREKYDAALNIYRARGLRLGEANALKALGDLSLREGDVRGARERYESALPIYHSLSDKLGEANTLQSLGSLLNSEGSYEDAIARLHEAFDIHAEIGNPHGVGACLAFWAEAANAMERHNQATLLCELALKKFRLIDDMSSEASTLFYQGKALLALGLKQQALAAWWQAREMFVRLVNSSKQGLNTILNAYETEVGSEEFSKFVAILQSRAEEIRLAGVAEARKVAGDDELIREIAERLRELEVE